MKDRLDYSWYDSSTDQKLNMIMMSLLDIQDDLKKIQKEDNVEKSEDDGFKKRLK